MTRLCDWRESLCRAAIELRDRPFVWGVSDCGLTAADLVASITGEDIAAPLRGYTSRLGATRSLLRNGCRSVAEFLDARLTRTKLPRAGDFVLIPSPPLDCLMVADGRGAAWGQGELALLRVPIPACALAWAV